MARICDICGKGVMSGNKVSKSYNHSRRTWRPNLHNVKAMGANGDVRTLKVCATCLSNEFYQYFDKKVKVPAKTEEAKN